MDFIITWLIKVFCHVLAIPFDLALHSLGEVFRMDGVAFLAVFGTNALTYYTDLFIPLAYALLLGLTLFSITKSVLGDKNEISADAPLAILLRLGLCFFAIKNALFLLQTIRSVFSVAYDWLAVELSNHQTISSQLEQVGDAIGEHLFANHLNFKDILDMSGLASGTLGLLFSTIFLIPVYFRIIRVMITFASRYVLRCVLELVSPLPFACGVSRSTSNILSNYLRLYVGILVSTIISAFLLKLYWAGAALLSYNMIHSVQRGVLTMFLLMGMYEVFLKVDTYINQIGLHGMAAMQDRRPTLSSIMQGLFAGTGLYKSLKGLKGGPGLFGSRVGPNPKSMQGLTPIGGENQKRLPMFSDARAHTTGGPQSMEKESKTSAHSVKGAMSLSNASSMMGQEYMRTGKAAGQAFRALMPSCMADVTRAVPPGKYKGALINDAGFQPISLRKNAETGRWEGAPIMKEQGMSEVTGADYKAMSELANEYGATAVSIGDGDDGIQFSIRAGETFVTSGCEKGFDKFVAIQNGIDPYMDADQSGFANTSIQTTAFGETGHIMATKVGNNGMQGYYYSPSVGRVEGVKASVISKEEYEHNSVRAVKLNNGMYLRFHKSDPDSAISKAAANVTFSDGRFIRKGKFTLNDDGSLNKE